MKEQALPPSSQNANGTTGHKARQAHTHQKTGGFLPGVSKAFASFLKHPKKKWVSRLRCSTALTHSSCENSGSSQSPVDKPVSSWIQGARKIPAVSSVKPTLCIQANVKGTREDPRGGCEEAEREGQSAGYIRKTTKCPVPGRQELY